MIVLISEDQTGFWNLSGVFLPGIYSLKMRKTCPILGFARAKPWRKKKRYCCYVFVMRLLRKRFKKWFDKVCKDGKRF